MPELELMVTDAAWQLGVSGVELSHLVNGRAANGAALINRLFKMVGRPCRDWEAMATSTWLVASRAKECGKVETVKQATAARGIAILPDLHISRK